jgi:hypothetical protein
VVVEREVDLAERLAASIADQRQKVQLKIWVKVNIRIHVQIYSLYLGNISKHLRFYQGWYSELESGSGFMVKYSRNVVTFMTVY